jgi:acid phosphatase type 7
VLSARLSLSIGVALTACATVVYGCGGSSPSAPTPSPSPTPPSPETGPPGPPATLVGAGDIGLCGSATIAATAKLVDAISGIVFTTGDNAYPNGSAANFRDCYEPHWGRHRARTRPTPGNHEYDSAGAAPYFTYFGDNAGPFGLGYYSYAAGPWRVIALNSEIPVGPGSAQLQWLQSELAATRARCTMVYWHKPLFTSGPNGPNRDMREIWRVLYDFDADLVVNGHDHLYERFGPQDPDGRLDPVRGIRQITVGTGGGNLYTPITNAANTEAIGIVYGVIKLTLSTGSYQWQFIPIPGTSFSDAGTGQCH